MFELSYGGVDAASVVVSRAELESTGWRVDVPRHHGGRAGAGRDWATARVRQLTQSNSLGGMDPTAEQPRWRGVNHLALVTTDMDATVRFYHGVLGARLVATHRHRRVPALLLRDRPRQTRSPSSSTGVERRAVRQAGRRARIPRASQFDHLSLDLPDEDALLALRDRLKEHDCEVTDVVDHGFMRSIYFTDPNGIALEASCWVIDATGRPADYGDGASSPTATPCRRCAS